MSQNNEVCETIEIKFYQGYDLKLGIAITKNTNLKYLIDYDLASSKVLCKSASCNELTARFSYDPIKLKNETELLELIGFCVSSSSCKSYLSNWKFVLNVMNNFLFCKKIIFKCQKENIVSKLEQIIDKEHDLF